MKKAELMELYDEAERTSAAPRPILDIIKGLIQNIK